jgi:glycerol-3-phosphate acyltransferase PlsY
MPALRFKGGQAIAVTGGVLLALPQYHLLLMFITFIVIAFCAFFDVRSGPVCAGKDACTAVNLPFRKPFNSYFEEILVITPNYT